MALPRVHAFAGQWAIRPCRSTYLGILQGELVIFLRDLNLQATLVFSNTSKR